MSVWRTVVCRNEKCGGGWWGEQVPARCPRCRTALTELAVTHVAALALYGNEEP